MKKCCLIVALLLCHWFIEGANAQNSSNKGRDFLVAYTGHIDGLASRLTLFLSADQATTYQVFIGTALISSGSIGANTCLPVIINPNQYAVYIDGSDVIATNHAIHVITTKPISLYSVISNNARTGGTMVLPTNTLGKEYYTFSYKDDGNSDGYAQFTIIATENDTEIEITPTIAEKDGKHFANQSFTINLAKGDIYQYQATEGLDLSGSYIKSNGCKPIAVFSGNTWASFCEDGNGRNPSGGDNLYQQLFPVVSWGRKFVTAPFYNTMYGNTDILRIIVAEDNTTVTVNGSTTNANGSPLANPYAKGAIITFASSAPTVIAASGPISVAQYQTSQSCNLSNSPKDTDGQNYPGDPEITVLNPVEQTLTNITVYSKLENVPTRIDRYYINVIIKTADISSFRLDGNPVTGFIPIDLEYSYTIIDVTGSQLPQHRLAAAGGFSAIAYGYGAVESYAYLAGANIQDFTFQPESAVTGQLITSGCLGEVIKLKINLPYKAVKIVWDLEGANPLPADDAPMESGTMVKNGILYYTYIYPQDLQYNTGGDYTFKLTATKPTIDACGNNYEELSAEFTVDNEPVATFEVQPMGCEGSEIQFKDKSISNSPVRSITGWLWDFGDGSTPSTVQHPIHTYLHPGTYQVTLTAYTDTKCGKTSNMVPITINPKPVAEFSITSNLCVNGAITIDNRSSIASGTIKNYNWDLGDGKAPINTSSAVPPSFKYDTPGTKIIKLTVTSDLACEAVVSKTIEIETLPEVDFTMPGYCLADGLAKFTNLSKNADGTTTGLTYTWEFGDQLAANPSQAVNGVHPYTQTGPYTVTLTATNQFGCSAFKSQTFIVNPYVEKADFSIQNEANLCSGAGVIINNISTIASPGKITKVEVYKDYDHDQTSFITVDDPGSADIHLSYPEFGGLNTRSYTIYFVAYSGEKCFLATPKPITIKPTPILEFDDIPAVCANDGLIVINQAREISGMLGTGTYSGEGMINGTNKFDPKKTGEGTFPITFTYKANGVDGCSRSITKNITVNGVPSVTSENMVYMLAGGEVVLPVKAEGTNLSYQWLPATNLNKANVLNPIANPDKDTEYVLTVSNAFGCKVTTHVMVKVLESVTVPNSFSPNGDHVNDTWNIKYLETYPNVTVEVFNRNGNKVFYSNGYVNPFDGNFHNEALPVGVYYYIVNPRNGRKVITGSLTIIR